MNQLCSSEVLPPEKDMRYKLRFVSAHEGQGRSFQEQETKRRGERNGEKRPEWPTMKPTLWLFL